MTFIISLDTLNYCTLIHRRSLGPDTKTFEGRFLFAKLTLGDEDTPHSGNESVSKVGQWHKSLLDEAYTSDILRVGIYS